MLLDLLLLIISGVLGYLFYIGNTNLKQLQKYSSNLESELLQKQIKIEELSQQSKATDKGSLLNANDPITGLPTTQVFHDRAIQTFHLSKRFGKNFGILFFDIHEFATLSAELGEEKTAYLLMEVGKRLNSCIRQIDTLSRYKDDNFLFLLPQLAYPEAAAFVAERILQKFKEPLYLENKELLVTPFIGISVFPEDGDNLNTIMEAAEIALDKAKATTNPYLFNNEELQQLNQRHWEISQILKSPNLTEKVLIYCLPQVNAVTNQIIGIKAIPYLNDSKLGLLACDEFVKIAERENTNNYILTGLLSKAIPQFKQWKARGLTPERLAVNVTAKQIESDEFINMVSQILLDNNFDPNYLAFEVDAENFSDNASAIKDSFLKLKNIGVQVSIGVFALGQLAIQKITQLPINYLKIDQRLIKHLAQYEENEMMLTALMDLSNSMGLETIAEGVDEEKQKSILQKLGFEIMQGKLFGDPQPIKLFFPPKTHSVE